jgi:hypothetical protein
MPWVLAWRMRGLSWSISGTQLRTTRHTSVLPSTRSSSCHLPQPSGIGTSATHLQSPPPAKLARANDCISAGPPHDQRPAKAEQRQWRASVAAGSPSPLANSLRWVASCELALASAPRAPK